MGSGKSLILKGIVDKYFKGKKVLIITGRRAVTLQLATYYEKHSYVLSGKDYDHSSNIFLATFQTLQRRDIDLSEFDMIAIDEAHERYETKVVKEIRELDCTRIYLTGTPLTPKGKFLGKFDNILEYTSAKQMIEDGYIARTVFISKANILSDESQIGTQSGDYKDSDIERVIDKQALVSWLVKDNLEYKWSTEHKAIMYTNSIATATKIYKALNDKENIRVIHSKLGGRQVTETMEWFKTCSNGIILNCRMLTVGIDIPSADTIINVTPTKILSLYLQSIWRASRPYKDKVATVYDYTGNLLKEEFSPYFDNWQGKKLKKSCKDQCTEFPENSIARFECLKSCTTPSDQFIVCDGKTSYSYEQNTYTSGYRLARGKPCKVGSPFYEWRYKNTIPENTIGVIRKWSECPNCKAVYVYDLKTVTEPSKAIVMYQEEVKTNDVVVIYNSKLKQAMLILDSLKTKSYKYKIVDSQEELYTYCLQYFKGGRFTITSSIKLPKLDNVLVDNSLSQFVDLINWESETNQGIMKKIVLAQMAKVIKSYGWKSGVIHYTSKYVNGNEKQWIKFLKERPSKQQFMKFRDKFKKEG